MSSEQHNDTFSEEETQRRFEAITRAVLTAPPLQRKDIPRKRPYKARKRKEPSPERERANVR